MTKSEQRAWQSVYFSLQAKGEEYYFFNASGFERCKQEAGQGVERAQKVWAMYIAQRMVS